MKTTILCLLTSVALRLAFDLNSQEVVTPTAKPKSMELKRGDGQWIKPPESMGGGAPRCLIIAGGVSGAWLTINRADVHGYDQRGFDPSYCYILCDPKPIIRKLKSGKWEITFVSEIAEDLP